MRFEVCGMPYSMATPASPGTAQLFRTFAMASSDSFQERISDLRDGAAGPCLEGREDHFLDVTIECVVEEAILGGLVDDHFASELSAAPNPTSWCSWRNSCRVMKAKGNSIMRHRRLPFHSHEHWTP